MELAIIVDEVPPAKADVLKKLLNHLKMSTDGD